MRRRDFIVGLAGAGLVGWPRAAMAQRTSLPVVGWLGSTPVQPEHVGPFLDGLAEGYVPNDNVVVRYRWADGHYDRLPAFAQEFVRQRIDLIAAITTVSARAAMVATNSIPTLFLTGADPVRLGFVASMNRPGGNRTGVSLIVHALDAKRLELIRELIPTVATVGVILNPNSATADTNKSDVQAAARTLGLKLFIVEVAGEADLEPAFSALAAQRIDALLVGADALLHSLNRSIIALAGRYRFPASYEWREHVQLGGLISYGTNIGELFRQAGTYGGRILKGAKPSDLPVLEPAKFELAINQDRKIAGAQRAALVDRAGRRGG